MLPHEDVRLSSSCWCWKAKIRIDAIHSSGIFMRTHFCHNNTSAWQRHASNICNSNWRLHISTGNIAQPTQMLCCRTIKIPLCVPLAVLLLCLMGWKDVSAAVQRQQIAIANINAFPLKHTNLRVLAGVSSVCVCLCWIYTCVTTNDWLLPSVNEIRSLLVLLGCASRVTCNAEV